jgi:hypothetical protein
LPLEIIVAITVLIAIVAAVAWWARQRQRTSRLRTTFGPEYERALESSNDRRAAEAELQARQERVDALDVRPLRGPDRARFGERWRIVQALFVDDPAMAVQQADSLIGEVMRTRGYPVGDFEQRAADISVDHPQVVDHYRTAHRIAEKRAMANVDTEQLRQAFVHYRALFGELLETQDAGSAKEPLEAERSDEPPSDRDDQRAGERRDTDVPAEPARRP